MFRESELPVEVGPYTLTGLLGKGGMALVYRASVDLSRFDFSLIVAHHEAAEGLTRTERDARRAQRLQRWARQPRDKLVGICDKHDLPYPRDGIAAVKVMLSQVEHLDRFRAEWESLLALGHPNVVRVFGGGLDDIHGVHYYAMELLSNVLAPPGLRELVLRDRVDLIRQAARGLDCLHQRGLVHRDVKPSNLICMRTPAGLIAKVADLGIAKDATRTHQLTATGALLGTPQFMAPEQAAGARDLGFQADVYSLGATLYAMLAGQSPHEGCSLYEVIARLNQGIPPVPLRELLGSQVPDELFALVDQMMRVDPAKRPSGMEAVITVLDRVLARRDPRLDRAIEADAPPDGATSLSPELAPTFLEGSSRPRWTHTAAPRQGRVRPRRLVLAALAVTTVTAGIGGILLARRPNPAPRQAEVPQPDPPPAVPDPVRVPDPPTSGSTDRAFADRLLDVMTEATELVARDQGAAAVAALDALTGDAEAAHGVDSLARARSALRLARQRRFEQRLATAGATALARVAADEGARAAAALEPLSEEAPQVGLVAELRAAESAVAAARRGRLDARLAAARTAARDRAAAGDGAAALGALDILGAEAEAVGAAATLAQARIEVNAARRARLVAGLQAAGDGALAAVGRDAGDTALDAFATFAAEAQVLGEEARLVEWRDRISVARRARFDVRLTAAADADLAVARAQLEALAGEARAVGAVDRLETAQRELAKRLAARCDELVTAVRAQLEASPGRARETLEALRRLVPQDARLAGLGQEIAAAEERGRTTEGLRTRLAAVGGDLDADRLEVAYGALRDLREPATKGGMANAWAAAESRARQALIGRYSVLAARLVTAQAADADALLKAVDPLVAAHDPAAALAPPEGRAALGRARQLLVGEAERLRGRLAAPAPTLSGTWQRTEGGETVTLQIRPKATGGYLFVERVYQGETVIGRRLGTIGASGEARIEIRTYWPRRLVSTPGFRLEADRLVLIVGEQRDLAFTRAATTTHDEDFRWRIDPDTGRVDGQ